MAVDAVLGSNVQPVFGPRYEYAIMPDFPDFTQHAFIDIVAQSLGHILNRPTYGGALDATSWKNVDATATTPLIEVLGEGTLYSGFLTISATGAIRLDKWNFIIDGDIIGVRQFGRLFDSNIVGFYGPGIYCTRWNAVTHHYAFVLSGGITFETGFSVTYYEFSGRTPEIRCGVAYALA